MRIGLFMRFFPPAFSGAGRQGASVAKSLVRLGFQVDVITPRWNKSDPSHEVMDGVHVHKLNGTWKNSRWSFVKLGFLDGWKIIQASKKWDVILFFSVGTETYVPLAVSRMLKIPIFLRVSLMGSDDLESISNSRAGKIRGTLIRNAHGVICTTEAIRRSSQEAVTGWGFNGDLPCHVIPNGVDTNHFKPIKSVGCKPERRKELGINSDALIGIFVGFIHQRKGVDHIIREWSQVHREHGNTKLLLVGPRKESVNSKNDNVAYLKNIDQLIQQEGLTSVVQWLLVDDVCPYLQVSDLFVFASHQEGFPNAVLEAMACGLPVFLVNRPWVPDKLIEHGKSGFLVSDTAGDMSQTILKALKQKSLTSVGYIARQEIENSFSNKIIANHYRKLFSSTVGMK